MTEDFSELDEEQHKGRIANWEKYGADAIKSDLDNGGTGIVGRHKTLAWKWLRRKQAQERERQLQEEAKKKSVGNRLKENLEEKSISVLSVIIFLIIVAVIVALIFGWEYVLRALETVKEFL